MANLFKNHKNDFILIGSILLVAIICLTVFILTRKNGSSVKIIIDGKEKYTYQLNKDNRVVIFTGENDQNKNILVIKNGKAFVESASCPDKICVSHRAISSVGQTIVCLPHKLVVEVE